MDTNAGNQEVANNCGVLPQGLPPAPAANATVASRPSSSRPTMAVHYPEPGGIPSAIDRLSSTAHLPSTQQVHYQRIQLQRHRGTTLCIRGYPITAHYDSIPPTNRPYCNSCPVSIPLPWCTICLPLTRAVIRMFGLKLRAQEDWPTQRDVADLKAGQCLPWSVSQMERQSMP